MSDAPALADPLAIEAHLEALRIVEALLFMAKKPLSAIEIAQRLPERSDVEAVLAELERFYAGRGFQLVKLGGGWLFRTAPELAPFVRAPEGEARRLSRAALETLAIIAYHQPVTRAEIEEIRGVSTGKGTLDILLESGWIKMRGRRRVPGRPITYGTTQAFLVHFGLESLGDLPDFDALKEAGLLQGTLPSEADIPLPSAQAEEGEENSEEARAKAG